MGRHGHLGGTRDHPPGPAHGGDELGDGVLGGHGVVEQGGVERPAGLAPQHPGGVDDGPYGVEDPLWLLGLLEPRPPIGEHRVIEAFVV